MNNETVIILVTKEILQIFDECVEKWGPNFDLLSMAAIRKEITDGMLDYMLPDVEPDFDWEEE